MARMVDNPRANRIAIATWLLACCALVFAMVVVGGITRLTHSGLSIVEWQPIMGTLPPIGEAQWEEAFAKYRATPEFRQRNHDMTVEGFKGIFWWEYVHRLLGRLIGVAFLLPFLYFLFKRRLEPELAWRLGGIFVLGALQGAMGWYMVQSGLVDEPRVSSLRLAAHLGLAFVIYGAMLWVALGLLFRGRMAVSDAAQARSSLLLGLVFLMVLSGALVAAIRAGYAYNTWPLMAGQLIPPDILVIEPWWDNLVHNMATVQFLHRVLALVIGVFVVTTWLQVRHEPPNARARAWSHALLAAAVLQIGLGIATLVLGVPIALAALHQAGAVVLFSSALGLRHALRR
jgi:cytochrome c oxidase assembly protein subunit 15